MQVTDRTTNISPTAWDMGSGWMATNGLILSAAIQRNCRRISRPAMSLASTFAASLASVSKTTCTSPKMARSCSRRRHRRWKILSARGSFHHTDTEAHEGSRYGFPSCTFVPFVIEDLWLRSIDFSGSPPLGVKPSENSQSADFDGPGRHDLHAP